MIAHHCPNCQKNVCHLETEKEPFDPDAYDTFPNLRYTGAILTTLQTLKTNADNGVRLENVQYTCTECKETSLFMAGMPTSTRSRLFGFEAMNPEMLPHHGMQNTLGEIQAFKERYA